MASTLNYLDSYCERAGDAAHLAEPLNAVTNLFFIVAAVLAAIAVRKLHASKPYQKTDLWLLVASLAGIGVGSSLWHLHPSGATVLMDVIPITLFINIYLIAALRRLYDLPWRKVVGWWGIYWAVSIAAQMKLPPGLLHGTIMYIPTYFTMVVLTFTLARRDQALGKIFAVVTTVWSLSLIFRTLDLEICEQIPIGTHFLWHTLNAWVLWRLLMVLVKKSRARH